MDEFTQKIIVACIGPIVTLGLAAFVGNWLSAGWAEKQKYRELELALANSFYALFGEFRSVWLEWNYYLEKFSKTDEPTFKSRRLILFERACKAEGALEAVLLKISAEKYLYKSEQVKLASLRQAYQVLRERMEFEKKISYGRSGDPYYVEFKGLATFIGTLLVQNGASHHPDPTQAERCFLEITDNKYETRWREAAIEVEKKRDLRRQGVAGGEGT